MQKSLGPCVKLLQGLIKANMGHRKNPWKSIRYASYEGFRRMPLPSDLRSRGQLHQLNRERVVASILREFYVLATLRVIGPHDRTSVKGAMSQSLSGSRSDVTEAAHCCPRQLVVGDKRPSELLQISFPERAFVIRGFFAETDILPANYNKADSKAELKGMSIALRDAARFVVEDGRTRGELRVPLIATAVRSAFDIFKNGSEAAFKAAIEALEDRLRFKARPDQERRWSEQLEILGVYLQTLKTSSGAAEVVSVPTLEGLIRIYREMDRTNAASGS